MDRMIFDFCKIITYISYKNINKVVVFDIIMVNMSFVFIHIIAKSDLRNNLILDYNEKGYLFESIFKYNN